MATHFEAMNTLKVSKVSKVSKPPYDTTGVKSVTTLGVALTSDTSSDSDAVSEVGARQTCWACASWCCIHGPHGICRVNAWPHSGDAWQTSAWDSCQKWKHE